MMATGLAVRVRFKEHGNWSNKAYTYKSTFRPEVGDKVVVPAGTWYGVGEVVAVYDEYAFKPDISYKFLIQKLIL
jgi:hypothetical protein